MKRFMLTLIFIFFILTLSACGIPENNPDIIADVSNRYSAIFEDVNLTSYEITKRVTEESKDFIDVTVTDTLSEFDVSLTYHYSEDKGWLLTPQECKISIPENTPDLFNDISEQQMPLWKQPTISSVNQLDSKQSVATNNITVEVLCETDDAKCTIQLECLYKFHAKKGWHFDSLSPINCDLWNVEPISGITQSEIEDLKSSLYQNGCGDLSTFDSVSLSYNDIDYSTCTQEISFDVSNNSGIKGISGLVTYRYNFEFDFDGNKLVWGWKQSSDSPFHSFIESYEKWAGKWYIDVSASKESGEYIIAISGNNIKILTPNGYTEHGVIDAMGGAYMEMRYSNVYDDTNTRVTFRDDGTIDYSSDGFMGRRVVEHMTRTPSYRITCADERFRNNFGY